MAWMDFEKFQTRSGNEPRASALERKIANEWMGAGYDSPSVTPYWQRGFTTEHSGVSPGGGNARTYQMPGKFGTSVAPQYGDPKFDFNVADLPVAGPEEEETYSQRANRLWNAQENYNKAQMLMNEPGARRTESELAEEWDNRFSSFTPHLQQGFEPGQGGKFGWPGNWPGTPLALGMKPKWNWSITPRARGGIASLENRPGYKWAGEVKHPWQRLSEGSLGHTDFKYSGERATEGPYKGFMTGQWRGTEYPEDPGIAGHTRTHWSDKNSPMDPYYFNTTMNPYYDDEISRRQNVRRADVAAGTSYGDNEFADSPRFTPAAPVDPGMWGTAGKTYGTTPDEVREGWGMEGPSETPLSTRFHRLRRGPWMTGAINKLLRLGGWNEGGAVGLEPGIGSLMGYAKGGMVTRVRVPKGQSKWMRRFVNNMRDS